MNCSFNACIVRQQKNPDVVTGSVFYLTSLLHAFILGNINHKTPAQTDGALQNNSKSLIHLHTQSFLVYFETGL